MRHAYTLIILALVLVTAANAQERCSAASLRGSYGFALVGTVLGVGPTVTIGVITFDGDGNASAVANNSRNGVFTTRPTSGTYTVDSNCIVSTTLGSGAAAQHWTEIIVDGGNEVRPMRVDPNTAVVIGMDRRLDDRVCTNATLNGKYGFTENGTLVSVGPFSTAGVITFDGVTNLSGSDTYNRNGTISQRSYAGDYSVNPDCSFSATLLDSTPRHIVGVIDDGGHGLRFMDTDAGATGMGSGVIRIPKEKRESFIDMDRRQ